MSRHNHHTVTPLRRSLLGGGPSYPRRPFGGDAWSTLDQVQELGYDWEGHTGCVNALSWSDDGSILLSGSDDKRVCIWTADGRNPPDGIQSSADMFPGRRGGRRGRADSDDDDDGERGPRNSAGLGLTTSPHPLRLRDTIMTGHRANIFSAKFLPHANSPTIVTCAGDGDVRVFEVDRLSTEQVGRRAGCLYGIDGPGVRVLRCHTDRTKRIATEGSPNLFMTVSEDGTVRQHDLRRPHRCRDECPDPLFRAPRGVDLYSLSISPLAPHTFAVAGQTDVAYICDRRKPEHQTPSWGPHTMRATQVHCVRRLGLPDEEWKKVGNGRYGNEQHITCVKISADHPDEVICAFATHSTSLFSLNDTPVDRGAAAGKESGIIPSNRKGLAKSSRRATKRRIGDRTSTSSSPNEREHSRPRTDSVGRGGREHSSSPTGAELPRVTRVPRHTELLRDSHNESDMDADGSDSGSGEEMDLTEYLRVRDEASGVNLPSSPESSDMEEPMSGSDMDIEEEDEDDERDGEEDDDDDDLDQFEDEEDEYGVWGIHRGARSSQGAFRTVDLLHPKKIYLGARNVDTVKDCNFLGDSSDKVCSGSDDGNWFMWDKLTGRLEGIWKGDDDVVNVMEQHPTLPLIAVSGIDSTVKIFSTTTQRTPISMDRTSEADRIVRRNARRRSSMAMQPTIESTTLQLLSQIIANRRAANPDMSGREHLLELFSERDPPDGDEGEGEPECRMQ